MFVLLCHTSVTGISFTLWVCHRVKMWARPRRRFFSPLARFYKSVCHRVYSKKSMFDQNLEKGVNITHACALRFCSTCSSLILMMSVMDPTAHPCRYSRTFWCAGAEWGSDLASGTCLLISLQNHKTRDQKNKVSTWYAACVPGRSDRFGG